MAGILMVSTQLPRVCEAFNSSRRGKCHSGLGGCEHPHPQVGVRPLPPADRIQAPLSGNKTPDMTARIVLALKIYAISHPAEGRIDDTV